MQISLYEFFIILIIGQCIFLIFAIQFISKKNSGTNRIIQYLLGIYSFYLLERIINSEIEADFFLKYIYFSNVFYLLIGPLIYTYIRRLLFYENNKFHLSFYHYIPVALYLIYGLVHLYIYDRVEDLGRYRTYLFYTVEILFFVSITTYVIKSYLIFNYYKKNENKELSFIPSSKHYIEVTLFCLALYMLFWLLGIFEIFDMVSWIERPLIYDISCLIFGFQIYVVSFYNLKHPEIFKITFPTEEKNQLKKRLPLDANEIAAIKHLVNTFFEDQKGYRSPDLNLHTLAKTIKTTTNKLSWVLNNSYQKTFYELVNEYRITDFLQQVKEQKHKEFTLLALAYEVGFNSKSTFYKVFKDITKMTPTAYINEM